MVGRFSVPGTEPRRRKAIPRTVSLNQKRLTWWGAFCMEEAGNVLGEGLIVTGTYWLNGLLAVVYWLGEHWTALASLALAGAAILLIDLPQAQETGTRELRYGRGQRRLYRPTAFLTPALLGLLWAGAAWITPPPVPYIGLVMWLGAILAVMALPLGKRALIHRLRWFIGVYALLALGFVILARADLSPQQAAAWSEHVQAAGAGEALEWAVRAQAIPYVVLILWFVFPLTYFGYLAQQLALQRRLLVSSFRSVADRIHDLRARGA